MVKKTILFLVSSICILSITQAQTFCFYDPNTGPLYHNGSSGGNYDVTSGDFNGDGHLDVVTANSVAANISFVPGYGNGTLGSPDTIPLGAVLFCITSDDFNGDGFIDVATASNANVFVLPGNGNGTFQPFTSYSAPGTASRLYSKDINNDSIPDLIKTSGNGIYVLTGQSNGIFLPAILYPSGGMVIDVAIADFDNDMITDIATTTNVSWTLSYLTFHKGIGNGTFMPPVITNVPHISIFGINSFDIDTDGNIDLIVSNHNNMVSRIEVYTGNGNGTFNPPVFYPALYNPNYVYIADMNNDLYNDVIVPEGSGYSVLAGNNNGTLNPFQYFVAAPAPNALAIGDFNEDGFKDFINPSGYSGLGYITVNLNCMSTGIENGFDKDNVAPTIFPNPVKEFAMVQLKTPVKNATLTIYNSSGQNIRTIENISAQKIIIERENLKNGIYFVRITQNGSVEYAGKIVVESEK